MSLGEIKQKLCANPVFSVASVAAVVAGACIAVKGVLLTAAAVSTSASVMSIALGAGIAVVGAYITVSACKNIKERLFDRTPSQLQVECGDSVISNVADVVFRVVMFQRVGV